MSGAEEIHPDVGEIAIGRQTGELRRSLAAAGTSRE
jgi:hypothetical protein